MCQIKEKSNLKEFTGYKIVFKRDGKYYSPATGIEYITGKKVQVITKTKRIKGHSNHEYGFSDPFGSMYFEPKMKGKTAVFVSLTGFESGYMEKEYGVIFVKMTISGSLYEASTDGIKTIAGNFIKSIEEIV